jgi:predicted transposase/invertase (TIGR01784 family)
MYTNSNFIMLPKIDFAFKLIFGDEKNKDILVNFLISVLKLPESEFKGIEIVNTELPKEFEENKKGILDIRIKTPDGKNIDIEIQLAKTKHMPERSLFYWSKMYASQIKSGDYYKKLKKCIMINIIDYEFIPYDEIHTKFHIFEDNLKFKLTDVLELHFLELVKINKYKKIKKADDNIIDWMEFLNADTKEAMDVLAKKNEHISKAYKILKKASLDEKTRLAYESREAALLDERSKIFDAKEDGRKYGRNEMALTIATNLLDILDDETIASKTGIKIDEVRKLRLSKKSNTE